MGDKISTIVLKVDLECEKCYKKLRRVLCRNQDKMNIKMISFDDKSGTVTVAGPFDAEEVCRKLSRDAGKVIEDMCVIGGKAGKESKEKDGGGEKPGKEKAEKKVDTGGKGEKDVKEKAEKKVEAGKGEKDGKEKAEKKVDAGKGEKDGKAGEKKVKFDLGEAPPPAAVVKAMPPLPAGMTKADLGPLLEKIIQSKQSAGGGPAPPRGEPMAAQGVAVPSIWPAPAGPVSCYGYNPASAYDHSPYYGGGGGYYGVPVQHDSQGWYYGNGRQPYYPHQHQQYCGEEPNTACAVM